MKINIIAIGKEKDFQGYQLVSEYSRRISHYISIEWTYIPNSTVIEEEKKLNKIIDKLSSDSYIIALDELGKSLTSTKFSSFIQDRMNSSVKSLVFIIGGSYGLSASIINRAQSKLALSSLTFPHQLVRLILAEQLYRTFTIIKGESYHH